MAHDNKVMKSVNGPDSSLCVDVFRRPDGTFGFEEYRRDLEDGGGWFPIGFHSTRVFASQDDAWSAAEQNVAWLRGATRKSGM